MDLGKNTTVHDVNLTIVHNDIPNCSNELLGFKDEQQIIQYLELRLFNISKNYKYFGSKIDLETLLNFWKNKIDIDYFIASRISRDLADNGIIKIDSNYIKLLENRFEYIFGLAKMQRIFSKNNLPEPVHNIIERMKKTLEQIMAYFY